MLWLRIRSILFALACEYDKRGSAAEVDFSECADDADVLSAYEDHRRSFLLNGLIAAGIVIDPLNAQQLADEIDAAGEHADELRNDIDLGSNAEARRAAAVLYSTPEPQHIVMPMRGALLTAPLVIAPLNRRRESHGSRRLTRAGPSSSDDPHPLRHSRVLSPPRAGALGWA